MPQTNHYPTLAEAEGLLAEAEGRNPGPWAQHSRNVAQAARLIAQAHPTLDPDRAYIAGLLHDIGRREGWTDMRHVLDGYTYLTRLGYDGPARISLTHSFAVQDIHAGAGKWDCTPEELAFAAARLAELEYTPDDHLIQLCDALALPSGFCLVEKRLVDVALRHGFNDLTLPKWQAKLEIKRRFEQEIGRSIYALLPGVVENTFGFSPE